MIINKDTMIVEKREKMRGGEGTVTITHMQDASEMKNCRLLAEITLPPGAGIGDHQHDNETEYYIILEGSGVVCDDGKDQPVKTGDVVITGNGASHNIRNNGTEILKMIAVIVTY